jgi:hypothetical protein
MKIFVEQGRSEQMRRKGAIFPWALSDAFAGDERRTAHADAIAARWLIAGGVRLPAAVTLCERPHHFERASLYTSSTPTVASAAQGTDAAGLRLAGVEGALRALGEPCLEGGELVESRDAGEGAGLVFHGIHTLVAATAGAPPSEVVGASVLEATMRFGVDDAAELSAGIESFQRDVAAGAATAAARSAVARAMLVGVKVRLAREPAPTKAKKARVVGD